MLIWSKVSNIREKISEKICEKIKEHSRWIVSECEEYGEGELGLQIGPMVFMYYKWPDPLIKFAKDMKFRPAEKREFGEVILTSEEEEKRAAKRRANSLYN